MSHISKFGIGLRSLRPGRFVPWTASRTAHLGAFAGLYTTISELLDSRGIGVVAPNYRLSPWVKYPQYI
jgi:hypothetical protein